MNSLRVSIVQYLNTVPLVRGFTHGPLRGKYDLSFTVPSQCAEALRNGAADIAIIPAIEYQRIPDLMILPDLAIASKKSVRSLLLVSKKPIGEVARIALDRTSRSTQTLLRILCSQRWQIAPEYFEADPNLPGMLERADAALIIGDPALRFSVTASALARRASSGGWVVPHSVEGLTEPAFIFDIVEEWRAMTNLPAVLAVWAARPDAAKAEIVKDFQDSLAFGLQQLDEIISESAATMSLPLDDLRQYFTENIDYHLDEENLRGLGFYYSLAAQLGLIGGVNTVDIAAAPGKPVRYLDFDWEKAGPRTAHG